jgi:hypothetical protein
MKIMFCAKGLASCYNERSERQVDSERIERELFKREMALTPAEGWPGKNAEQREFEKAKTLAGDEIYAGLTQAKNEQQTALTLLNGTIEALEAERRGFEWQIRANLVTVLAGAAIERNGGQEATEAAFDDTAQDVADDEVLYQAVKASAPAQTTETDDDDVVFDDHPVDFDANAEMTLLDADLVFAPEENPF